MQSRAHPLRKHLKTHCPSGDAEIGLCMVSGQAVPPGRLRGWMGSLQWCCQGVCMQAASALLLEWEIALNGAADVEWLHQPHQAGMSSSASFPGGAGGCRR